MNHIDIFFKYIAPFYKKIYYREVKTFDFDYTTIIRTF